MNALHVRMLLFAALIPVCLLPAISCKKHKSDDGGNGGGDSTKPDKVYVAGIYDRMVTWWQDSAHKRTSLSDLQQGNANAIFVAGKTVYVAGYLIGSGYQPVYWTDGVKTGLSTSTLGGEGFVAAIQVAGNDVYLAGYTLSGSIEIPCTWKNGVRTDLSRLSASRSGRATALVLAGSDVYVAGYTIDALSAKKACYWKNGERTDLVTGSREYGAANAIAFANKTLYVAGFTKKNTDSAEVPCYWTNKAYTALSRNYEMLDGNAMGMHVSGSDVYIAGYTHSSDRRSVACLWKNGSRTDLPFTGRAGSFATAVQALGGNVYVAGTTYDGPDAGVPCYWKNGNRIDLEDAGIDGSAWAIYVTK